MFNPSQFSQPLPAFFLGVLNFIFYVMIEIINIYATLQKVTVDQIISRFVSYALLLQIPQIYMRQRKMFNIKFDVDDFFLTVKKEKKELDDDMTSVGRSSTTSRDYKREIKVQKLLALKSVNGCFIKSLHTCLTTFYRVLYYY